MLAFAVSSMSSAISCSKAFFSLSRPLMTCDRVWLVYGCNNADDALYLGLLCLYIQHSVGEERALLLPSPFILPGLVEGVCGLCLGHHRDIASWSANPRSGDTEADLGSDAEVGGLGGSCPEDLLVLDLSRGLGFLANNPFFI